MYEDIVSDILVKEGIEYIISLPCDRTKILCEILEKQFHYITISREEDGIGILSGLSLTGKRGILQMQSSGLGNSLNALMTLPFLYSLPLPVLASWRGYYQEKIAAQIPFNEKIPDLLSLYGIPCTIIREPAEFNLISSVIRDAWKKNRPHVALISPAVWEGEEENRSCQEFPVRERLVTLSYRGVFKKPVMQRGDAISVLASMMTDELVVSNIGVPSKELYHVRDDPSHFYMLGSYTQASPLGLGIACGTNRKVVVLDGDGSLLGTAVLPVIGAESPENLVIVCLDNGVYGSTGNQCSPAYKTVDLELLAKASGISQTFKVHTSDELSLAYPQALVKGPSFIHVVIIPGNRNVSNIPLTPYEIKKRFVTEINPDF
ncbi:MAG: sulfopyruvate decarboxylase subunit beta [Methanomicrobiales archaeon]|nr:sulfopyruvate decarboxylase subunit beta [Methanomicrobiales archaeon]